MGTKVVNEGPLKRSSTKSNKNWFKRIYNALVLDAA
jgi:hypothetical protein